MASQTIDLGDGPDINVGFDPAVQIDSSFIEGGGEAYLRFVRNQVGSVHIRLSASQTEAVEEGAPHFTTAFEIYASAFTFTSAGGTSIVLKGPNHADNSFPDPDNLYLWTPDNSADWNIFANAVQTSGNLTLTLNDGGFAVPTAPDPPTLLTIDDSQIQVSFSAPSSDGGAAITEYLIRSRIVGEADWNTTITLTPPAPTSLTLDSTPKGTLNDAVPRTLIPIPTDPTTTIGSLTSGAEYEIQVGARNSAGDSPWSASARATTQEGTSEEVVRAVITAGEANNWYSIFGIQDIGSFTGDMLVETIGANEFSINRVWWTANANGDLRLNRNPANVARGDNTDFNIYFGTDGPGEDYSIYAVIGEEVVEVPVTQRRSIGPHYINLTPTAAQATILSTVNVGDEITFAIGRNIVFDDTPVTIEYSIEGVTAGIPSIPDIAIDIVNPIEYSVEGVATGILSLPNIAIEIINPTITIEYTVENILVGIPSLSEPAIEILPGTVEVVRAIITVGEDNNWFSVFDSESVGSFTGDMLVTSVGDNELNIDRVWWTNNDNNDFRLNRNPGNVTHGDDTDFSQYFAVDGPGSDYSIYIQIGSEVVEIPATQRRSIGPHYINLTPTAAQTVILNTVSANDLVTFVIGRGVTFADPPITIEYSVEGITTGIPVFSDTAITVIIPTVSIEYAVENITTGIPIVSDLAIEIVNPIEYSIEGVTAGTPTLPDIAIEITNPAITIEYSVESITSEPVSLSEIVIEITEPPIEPVTFRAIGGKLTSKYVVQIKERILNHIPVFYSESEIINNIYNAIAPELELLLNYVSTPDYNYDNVNEDIKREMDEYLANTIGWGFERLINQFFVISANDFLDEYVQIYGTVVESDYIRLRNKLLLYSAVNKSNNQYELEQDLRFIGEDIISNINIQYPLYTINITLNPLGDAESLAIIQRQFDKILPSHMLVNISTSSLSLDSMPQGTINDLIPHTLG